MIANGAIMDLNCFLKFMILVMIILFVGFLAWIENKVANSNEVNNNTQRDEVVQVSDEINLFFEQDHDDNTISNGLSEYCACSFCGKLSKIITTCSRCKNAIYCSKECHVMHGRFWHRDECVDEIVSTEDNEESSSHGAQRFLLEPGNEILNYSFNDDDDEKIYEGNVYYIEGGENNVESSKETSMRLHHGIVSNYDSCAVCGNPCSKKCSRCKAIKYCSQTCQHFDWRSGHKFQCFVTKKSSAQETTTNQEWHANENVIMPPNLDDVKDNGHSYDPLCLEFYPEENSNTKALILSYQEASNKVQEVEQQMKSLKEELKMIRNENISLQSKLNYWEIRAKYSADRLYSFKKENEHQLFILKHENELISNAEKQARQMVTNLSQRIHCLQIAVETGVAERKKQEEFILVLQNECAKTKREFQEQNKYVERLIRQKIDDATQFPMKVAEEAGKESGTRIISADESKHTSVEVLQTISLSRNPTLTRQCCTICLTNEKDLAFGCGHMTCRECGSKIRKCHICRKKITNRIRLFPG